MQRPSPDRDWRRSCSLPSFKPVCLSLSLRLFTYTEKRISRGPYTSVSLSIYIYICIYICLSPPLSVSLSLSRCRFRRSFSFSIKGGVHNPTNGIPYLSISLYICISVCFCTSCMYLVMFVALRMRWAETVSSLSLSVSCLYEETVSCLCLFVVSSSLSFRCGFHLPSPPPKHIMGCIYTAVSTGSIYKQHVCIFGAVLHACRSSKGLPKGRRDT